MLERLRRRERIILYLTFVVVVSSLIYNFLLEPIVERYRLLNQEVIRNQVKLQKYLSLLRQKERIKQDFDKISEGLKTDYSEQEQMALILSEIEGLSRRSSVHITQIKPQPTKDFGTYKEFPVEIRAEAKIENLSQFIYNLQNSPQLLRTKKLFLNTKSATSDILETTILISKIALP